MQKEKKIRTIQTIKAKSFSVNLDEVELPSKKITERIRVEHPDAAALIPILDDERILFVKQWRYSIQEETLEIPAGKIDLGESPESCIRREFVEETGYTVKNLDLLIKYVPAIGYSSEILYIFKGTGIIEQSGTPVSPDEISDIQILSFNEIVNFINKGIIIDGKTIIAMYSLFSSCFREER
ncbi:MAG: NUDIX hydrolase [Candidatus Hodarchaeales archaeon]|jgi:ADP-ribose pyrophosphatase